MHDSSPRHPSSTKSYLRLRYTLPLATALALACGGDATSPEPGTAALQLEKTPAVDQATYPDSAVPTSPRVRVVDGRGQGVAGAVVRFQVVGGGGLIDRTVDTTDAAGHTDAVGWTAGPNVGANLLEARLDGTTTAVTFRATAGARSIAAAPVTVGAAGGELHAILTGSGIDSVTISVPAGAYASATTFRVSTAAIPSAAALPGVNGIARLRIDNGGVATDSTIEVRVPLRSEGDRIVSAYWYDSTTHRLEPAPVIDQDSSSVTLAIRRFAWRGVAAEAPARLSLRASRARQVSSVVGAIADVLFTSVDEKDMRAIPSITTSFQPGRDDWEFTNQGSSITEGGNCLGQTLTAAWYHDVLRPVGGTLYNKYAPLAADRLTQFKGQDDNLGYRLASVVQADLEQASAQNPGLTMLALIKWQRATMTHRRDWLLLLDALRRTGEPQLVTVFVANPDGSPGAGHAVLAYRANPTTGEVWIADPNHPGARDRRIRYDATRKLYDTYTGGQKAQDGDGTGYAIIRFVPRSFIPGWNTIADRWAELESETVGNAQPNAFPPYVLGAKGSDGTFRIPADTGATPIKVHDDSVTIMADASTIYVAAHDSTGKPGVGTNTTGSSRVALALGSNRFRTHLHDRTGEPGAQDIHFVDFTRFRIVRVPLALTTVGGARQVPTDTIRFDSGVARRFAFRFETGEVADSLDYRQVTVANSTGDQGVTIQSLAYGAETVARDSFGLRLTAPDTGIKRVQFDVRYRGKVIQRVLATVERTSVALSINPTTVTGTRTSSTSGDVSAHLLLCTMSWKVDVLGSPQRTLIGENYRVTPDSGAVAVEEIVYPAAEQRTVGRGTYTGTGSWDWTVYRVSTDPPRFMPFTVEWQLRYRNEDTGAEENTNAVTMRCQ